MSSSTTSLPSFNIRQAFSDTGTTKVFPTASRTPCHKWNTNPTPMRQLRGLPCSLIPVTGNNNAKRPVQRKPNPSPTTLPRARIPATPEALEINSEALVTPILMPLLLTTSPLILVNLLTPGPIPPLPTSGKTAS